MIWYDVHYVITLPLHYITPLHLWWYQGWFSMRPGDWRDPDFWFWSNLDITLLTPHSLPLRDITTCWSGNNRGNSSSTSRSKTWACISKRSLLPVFTCKHRKDKLVFESELDYRRERAGRGDRDVIKITLDMRSNYTQFTRRGQAGAAQCGVTT